MSGAGVPASWSDRLSAAGFDAKLAAQYKIPKSKVPSLETQVRLFHSLLPDFLREAGPLTAAELHSALLPGCEPRKFRVRFLRLHDLNGLGVEAAPLYLALAAAYPDDAAALSQYPRIDLAIVGAPEAPPGSPRPPAPQARLIYLDAHSLAAAVRGRFPRAASPSEGILRYSYNAPRL